MELSEGPEPARSQLVTRPGFGRGVVVLDEWSSALLGVYVGKTFWTRDGLRDFDALSKEEQRSFASYFTSVLRRYENLLYQTQHGTLDPDAWLGVRKQLGFAFSQPGAVLWWEQAKSLFHPQLVEFIDNEIR